MSQSWVNASVSPGIGHIWWSSTGVGIVSLLQTSLCAFFGKKQVRDNQLDHIIHSSNRNMKFIRCNSRTFNHLQNLNSCEIVDLGFSCSFVWLFVVWGEFFIFVLVLGFLVLFLFLLFYFSLLLTNMTNTQKRYTLFFSPIEMEFILHRANICWT